MWRRLAGEMALPGLTLPEKLGGGGLTETELAIAFEKAGASLLCAPLFATAGLAVPLLAALGDEAALVRFGPAIAASSDIERSDAGTARLATRDARADPLR